MKPQIQDSRFQSPERGFTPLQVLRGKTRRVFPWRDDGKSYVSPRSAGQKAGGDPIRLVTGFTFLELIVAVSIFVLLLAILSGSYATFVRGQRSGLSQATLLGDVQTFLELLEREVRTGYGNTFRCGAGEVTGDGHACTADRLVFTNQDGAEVTYALAVPDITRDLEGAVTDLTAPSVEARELEFVVQQATKSDPLPGSPPEARAILTGQQGRVTVRVRLCPRGIDDGRCLALQTTLTSRQYGPI